MKITCIYNDFNKLSITVGREYEVIKTVKPQYSPILFSIMDDNGYVVEYKESCFYISHWSFIDKLKYRINNIKQMVFRY